MENLVKIYSLNDPNTMEVRYVGKTVSELKNRLYNHIYESKRLIRRTHKNHWIKKLLENNQEPIIELIEVTDEDNWEEREVFWINYYNSDGRLLNIMQGGNVYPGNNDKILKNERNLNRVRTTHKKIWPKESIEKMSLLFRKIQPDQEQEFINMYNNDVSKHDIFKYFGISNKAYHNIRKRLNLTARTVKSQLDRTQIEGLYIKGLSLKKIAKQLNTTEHTISDIIKDMGLCREKIKYTQPKQRSLTPEQVLEVKKLRPTTKAEDLMKMFSCSRNTIFRAVKGQYD